VHFIFVSIVQSLLVKMCARYHSVHSIMSLFARGAMCEESHNKESLVKYVSI
jgi:hypothetical protein